MSQAAPGARILIVEDEGIVALDLKQRLEKLGHAVIGIEGAADGALRVAAEQRPNLVLMDVRLRGEIDGIGVAEAIRRVREVPVVFVTAFSDSETLARAATTQPFGYVIKPVSDADLEAAVTLALYRSETDRLAAGLRQAQKLAAVRRLAGGVAHEFNNLMAVVLGAAELVAEEPALTSAGRQYLASINEAAQRTAMLTRQLLAFGQKQMFHPRPFDLNAAVRELDGRIRQTAGDRASVEMDLCPQVLTINGSRQDIELAVLSLVSNARDAMPGGGTIAIRTELADEGSWVRLSVRDQGVGMSAEVLDHVFEPFFSTKEVGQGTGLGLAAVYGTVALCGGHVDVQSAPGRGTTVVIRLPLHTVPQMT